ncbi:uncharacterized protein LOC129222285 [Uloborus diversus]|uniref:uncharacterized protein LOC129222285 n=1 Tax=Uloborus diversus TaxID=327109 RepID=UPI0024099DCF|nr:uncharacterized protein LOC129222285 [Uloborus diversus]
MSRKFYNSVIDEECKLYGIKSQMIQPAFKTIGYAYCPKNLNSGETFVNYDNPRNRCAYLYKFAEFHTSLVCQYFTKFLRKKEGKEILMSKQTLEICCLGGGPGTDIIGIFKALAQIPHFHKKIVKVVILDICRGWCNSFKIVVSSLLKGKIKGIPADFIDTSKFIADIIEVNLLEPLPVNVVEVIAAADIICSVKFISAICSKSGSLSAMKTIADNIKPHAVVLFIDNPTANICKFLETISEISGFKILLGPLHEKFQRGVPKKSNKAIFDGICPTTATNVSVIGMVKSEETGVICNDTVPNSNLSLNSTDGGSIGKVESETYYVINKQSSGFLEKEKLKLKVSPKVNKFTQTDAGTTCALSNVSNDCTMRLVNVLESLASSMNLLLVNVEKYVQKACEKKCCSCCHS